MNYPTEMEGCISEMEGLVGDNDRENQEGLKIVILDFLIQCSHANIQQPGRFGFVALREGQYFLNVMFLQISQRKRAFIYFAHIEIVG